MARTFTYAYDVGIIPQYLLECIGILHMKQMHIDLRMRATTYNGN